MIVALIVSSNWQESMRSNASVKKVVLTRSKNASQSNQDEGGVVYGTDAGGCVNVVGVLWKFMPLTASVAPIKMIQYETRLNVVPLYLFLSPTEKSVKFFPLLF